VELDRDDPGASEDQRRGERALAGPDIKDEFARADTGLSDDPRSPLMIEPMPSPRPAGSRLALPIPGGGGHGGPSP